MEDDEKQLAILQLLAELEEGVKSLREQGGLSIDETFAGLED